MNWLKKVINLLKCCKKNNVIDDVIEVNNARNATIALRQFETFLNKPFDYQGSLSYYSRKAKAIADAE